jgi:hypothetical protein
LTATRKVTQEARERLAEAVEGQGSAWRNAANSIRAGYETVWLTPALIAIDIALDQGRREE